MVKPTRVVQNHRRAINLVIDAEALLPSFPLDAANNPDIPAWSAMSFKECDDACLERAKLLTLIPKILAVVPPTEYGEQVRTDWMDGAGRKYNAFANVTVGQIVERVQAALARLRQTRMYTALVNFSSGAQYYGEGFRSLAVTSVPTGHLVPTDSDQKSTPAVHVFLDSKNDLAYVNSSGQMVKRQAIQYYSKTINQDWRAGLMFRREIALLLMVAHKLDPRPASFAEINLALEDQRHVPLLATELGNLGLLGGISKAQVDATTQSRRARTRAIAEKVKAFLQELRGDERAFAAPLVRAAAILSELLQLNNDILQDIKLADNLDRSLWLTMREAVRLTMMSPTFQLNKDAAAWEAWLVKQVTSKARKDGDVFFRLTKIFEVDDLAKILEICPIAANRPLELAMPVRDVLDYGISACGYAPDGEHASVYRSMLPTYTRHYTAAMMEMFGSEGNLPPVPTQPHFPRMPPRTVRGGGLWLVLAAVYEYEVELFTDGRPAESTWTIILYLKELHKALMDFDCDRFEELQGLRKEWEEKGWLEVKFDTTGYNNNNLAQRDSDYHRELGQIANTPNEYRQQQSEEARKQKEQLRAMVGSWPTITERNVITFSVDAPIVSDKPGTAFTEDPVTEKDMAGMF